MTPNQPNDESQNLPLANDDQPPRRNILFLIVVILVGGVVPLVGIAYFIFAVFGSLGNISGLNTGVSFGLESRPISGNPGRFDPLLALPEITAFAGENAQLIAFHAYYVRLDGTMDMNATYTPAPHVEYRFINELLPPEDATPPAEETAPTYELVTIEVYHPGEEREATRVVNGETETYTYGSQGMIRIPEAPTESVDAVIAPKPECGLYQLWAVAVTQGVPQDGVAIIDYTADGYTFTFGEDTVLTFNLDCSLRE
ncbi:MAG: hypothetical protein H6672_00700 [Anaerolineaceae bacterium]|nr:hypothetical protein [Anaerolineaceae bacterium]